MYRGTTPTLKFELPFSIEEATKIYVTFVQEGRTIFEKQKSNLTIEGNLIEVKLSQGETLQLKEDSWLNIQIRCTLGDNAFASQILEVPVRKILKEGVI